MKELNARQHRFVINLLSGMSQTEAYIQAGYNVSREVAKVKASELVTKDNVRSLYHAKRDKQMAIVEDAVLAPLEKRAILATIARAQLSDLLDTDGNIKLDKNSKTVKALREWSRRVRVDREGNPVVSQSAKLIDPITAIQEDNKMMGDYAPSKHLIGQRIQFEVVYKERDVQRQGEAEGSHGGESEALQE